MEKSDHEAFVARASEVYASIGQQLRVDGVAHQINDVEFCQHKPLQLASGHWVMVPNPRKVLQTAFMAYGQNRHNMAYFGTLWDMRARVHAGVPVYQNLFCRLARWNTERLSTLPFFGFEHADPHLPFQEVGVDQREQFDRQWNFSIDEQIAWENARVNVQWFTDLGDPADWVRYASTKACQ